MSENGETEQPAIDQLVGDPNIRPQDDFYHHICQSWIDANPRPDDQSKWDQVHALKIQVLSQVTAIVHDWLDSKPSQLTGPQEQVVDFYRTILAKNELTGSGITTLDRIHQKHIAGLTFDNLATNLGALSLIGVDLFWNFNVRTDIKNNHRNCLYLQQGGLSLPDRDYYLEKIPKIEKYRHSYKKFITNFTRSIITEINLDRCVKANNLKQALLTNTQSQQQIFDFEAKIAELSWPRVKNRDPLKTYNAYSWDKFCSDFIFDWPAYFKAVGTRHLSDLVVCQPDYLTNLLDFLKNTKLQTIKNYLTWRLTVSFGSNLNERTAIHYFDFYARDLAGQSQMKPIQKRALEAVNHNLADTIGEEYIARYYSVDNQKHIRQLTEAVARSLRNRLKDIKWLSPESRFYAQKKLDTIVVNLGQPANWHNYTDLKIDTTNLIQTYINLADFETGQNLKKLQQKPNRYNFPRNGCYAVQSVTAWSVHSLRSTTYPAAILQPPFYDHQASFAANLGSIGSIIGHELIHQFDRSGRQYDHHGNLAPWFTEQDQKLFRRSIQPLIELADTYKIDENIYINGELVISEFLADLSGLSAAISVIKDQQLDSESQNLALKQLFSAYAYHWAGNFTAESRILRAKTDPHPDIIFRVNGVLPHIPEFYQVYDVKSSDKMFLPEDKRVSVW